MTNPRIKYTVADYMTTPDDKRYELLDGELIMAPAPTDRHQVIVGELFVALRQFILYNRLGQVRLSPYDVIFADTDVAQPDILFVSNERSDIITPANIQGAPDLMVEILSPGTAGRDRGYKRTLYGRHGVQEYWLVDPDANTVEVLVLGDEGLTPATTFQEGDTLTSPLLAGLSIELRPIFA